MWWGRLKALIVKELLAVLRDPKGRTILIGPPIIQLLVFSYAATLEVKNSFGSWETVPFVREEGRWKIDKKGYADRLMQEVEQSTQQMDDFINQGKEPTPEL